MPQKKIYPPESKEIRDDMTREELIEVGESIVSGKGTCLSCHKMEGEKGRFPKLGGMGATAKKRAEAIGGLTDVEYLAQSMYEPNAYIVEGFNPGMPPINKPPINLSDKEILAVIAYLQSLGGEPTVDLTTKLKWQTVGSPSVAESPQPAQSSQVVTAQNRSGPELIEQFNCKQCHSIDDKNPMVGPPLFDVGSRLNYGEIYESLLNPDATVAAGFTPVMGAALKGFDFYSKVSLSEFKTLAEYLVSKKGDK